MVAQSVVGSAAPQTRRGRSWLALVVTFLKITNTNTIYFIIISMQMLHIAEKSACKNYQLFQIAI
jgi:hypothetical protein